MNPPFRPTLATVVLTLCLLPVAASQAQGVYKCDVGGKVSYQSSPCATGGKAVEINAGPTDEQVQEARKRADAEKARAASITLPSPQVQQRPVARGVNCAQLNQNRAEAYGRRNAAVRSSQQSNIDQSDAVNRELSRIQSTESQLARGGCKVN